MKYKIATLDDGVQETEGEVILIEGFQCGLRLCGSEDKWGASGEYDLTELSTGFLMMRGFTKNSTITSATDKVRSSDMDVVIKKSKRWLKKLAIKYPVNETIKI